MKHIVDTKKTIEQAATDLHDAVTAHSFGVLHSYNLKETLKSKGIDLPRECRIFEICNPHQASAILSEDMELNMALPCRISVWDNEGGQVKIGMLLPKDILSALSGSPAIQKIAEDVEETMKRIIAAAQ